MKKILITGGISGLGKEIVLLALQKGYSVDILDILPLTENLFGEYQKHVQHIHFDLGNIDEQKLSMIGKDYDICICNAGISVSGNFTDIDIAKERSVFEINTLGHIELVKYLLNNACIKEGGNIAFTLSATQILPFPIALSYAASKGALHSFAHALRSYLTGKNISISSIYPGPMPTEHVKYYGKKIDSSKKSLQKVQKIAQKILKGVEKRKKHIYPDITSFLLSLPIIRSLNYDKIMYKAYKKDLY